MENNLVTNLYKPKYPTLIRRIAAFIIDFICVLVVAVGICYLLSVLLHFDDASSLLDSKYIEYGIKYYDEEGNLLNTDTKINNYNLLWDAFNKDELAIMYYNKIVDLSLIIPLTGIGIGIFIFEFIVPLILKHGRTIGYFVFKIALISNDDIEISNFSLFTRFLLGKLIINSFIPIICVLMIMFNRANLFIIVVLFLIIMLNIVMGLSNPYKATIPDRMAKVYPCDYEGQVFFKTIEELNIRKGKDAAKMHNRND